MPSSSTPPDGVSWLAWNNDLRPTADLVLFVGCTVAWGVVHLLVRPVFRRLAIALVPLDDPAAPPAAGAAAGKDEDAKRGSAGTSDAASELRRRKGGDAPAATTAAGGPETEPKPKTKKKKRGPDNRVKFEVALWRFCTYFFPSLYGIYVLGREVWPWHPKMYFEGYPAWPMGELVRWYYAIGFGNYVYGFFSLVVLEPHNSDFLEMVIHHIATISVISVSYFIKMTRVGVVILLLHDVSDPFMEIAKCVLYTKRQKIADILFACFAFVFIYTRNYLFPFYVIAGIVKYCRHEDGVVMPYGSFPLHYGCVALLCILEVLHIYWAILILRMAVTALFENKVPDDVRVIEDEDE